MARRASRVRIWTACGWRTQTLWCLAYHSGGALYGNRRYVPLEWYEYDCKFCVRNCANMKPNSLCCSKQDRFKLYGLREAFSNLFSLLTPPGLASSFPSDRNLRVSKGASFSTISCGVCPWKQFVSIFYTRLLHLHRRGPLNRSEATKGKNTKIFGTQPKKNTGLGRMAQTPRANTGDSVGRFCCYPCSTLIDYNSNLSMWRTFKIASFPWYSCMTANPKRDLWFVFD